MDAVEAAAERGGEGFLIEEPEEDEAMAEAKVSYTGVRVHGNRCKLAALSQGSGEVTSILIRYASATIWVR